MRFEELAIQGAFLLRPEIAKDERGYFARTFSMDDFLDRELDVPNVQASTSFSPHQGTLRGMHYQEDPDGETKLIRCTRGKIFDAAIDLRRDSPTFRQTVWVTLDQDNLQLLYLPKGLAHGFLTLTASCEVAYQMSTPFSPNSARGIRYNDPAFDIPWPSPVRVISERDRSFPDFQG